MPTYFLSNIESDVSPNNLMFSLSNTTTTLQVSVASAGTSNIYFITPKHLPNNSSFTVTNATVVVVHTVINKNLEISARLHRVNSSGSILASGTAAAAQTTASTNTFSNLSEPSWSSANCSDRILLQLTYVNSQMSTQTCTIGTDRGDTYCLTSISHNGSNCIIDRKPSFTIYKK